MSNLAEATPFEQPALETPRMELEPITEAHAEELCALFADPELHRFTPYQILTLERQRDQCARWAKRRSPDGLELWLNWAGRDRASGRLIAHFQAGARQGEAASVGYVLAREFQGKGLATEALESVFVFLRDELGVSEVKAWADTRNTASHRLAKRLGMVQVDRIKNADHFNGASSDELVFSKSF